MRMRALQELDSTRFQTVTILGQLARTNRKLAELKGLVSSIPNESILVNTLGLQEAKDSSAIESIVTTHDELFRSVAFPGDESGAAKEVARYAKALHTGFELVTKQGLLATRQVVDVQAVLEPSRSGFRKVPGTTLKDDRGRVVYTPPSPELIPQLMSDLDRFLNDAELFDADPVIKMALAHHQFESIHPFYDGNGRTGRILCVLYLVKEQLLDLPVLYLSRHIVRTTSDYYRLLQDVRERDSWEAWVLYMLTAVERTSAEGIATVKAIREALLRVKHRVRKDYKFYSQDLINNIFTHPYTKIAFVQQDLGVERLTATRYLDALASGGVLRKKRVGRSNYYINVELVRILTGKAMTGVENG
ncbi:MAG: Fic family protein [Vicinamibacterales bacterium]